jgi:acyl-CoA thioester hydrolase
MTAPHRSAPLVVEDGWIDYNGHLNMAYYSVLFDRALDAFAERLGVGRSYVTERNATLFTLEVHVCYLRELKAGERVVIDTQIVDHDARRIHFFQSLSHADAGFLSATSEQLVIHIDLGTRRSAPFPDDRLATLARVGAEDRRLPRPENAGRSIGLRKHPK